MTARRRATLTLILAAVSAAPWLTTAEADDLVAIGQRFEAGDVMAARNLYLEWLSESPSAAVHYNLGRVDQTLGAGPQAVLWYRRALDLAPEDPWARENLSVLRDELGLPPPEAGLSLTTLMTARAWSGWIAALALGLALAFRLTAGRPRGWALISLAAVLVSGHAGIRLAARSAPVDAVLMAPCGGAESNLPAGSEVWVSRRDSARVWSTGTRFECDPETVIRVRSDELPPELAALPPSIGTRAEDAAGDVPSGTATPVDGPLA